MFLIAIFPLLFHQIETTSPATRAGFAKWAATAHGREMIEYLAANHCDITVIEDPSERGIGRAPEPGIATLVAAYRSKPRGYVVILNPLLAGQQPARAAEAMAIAWAGEMLHVYFYAHGINLPHHSRPDFQQEWQAMAAELGMPTVPHDDDDGFPHSAIVRYVGYGR